MQDLKEAPYSLVKEKRESHDKQPEIKTDLVSVITPSYNCARFIEETIRSVQAQTWQNWEMVIVDDCSTDNSVEVIRNLAKTDSRIRLIEHQWNGGPAVARNIAIEHAKGRYIAFLDSDDLWLPKKLEKQIAHIDKTKAALVYGAYQKITEAGELKGVVHPPAQVTYDDMLRSNFIGCLTAIYDRQKIGKCYMPIIAKRQDQALWLKILKKTPAAYCLDEVLAHYRIQENSVSSNKVMAAKYQWRIYREVEQLPFWKSARCFGHYAINGLIKYHK